MSRRRQRSDNVQAGTESQVLASLSPIPLHICNSRLQYSPVSVVEDATGTLSLESGGVGSSYLDSEHAGGTHTSLHGWTDVALEEYSQTLPASPHIGYDLISPSEPQSFNTIPVSSHIHSDTNIESLSTYSPLPPHFNDICYMTPAASTSPDPSSWYPATPLGSDAASDTVEGTLDPSVGITHSFKPVIASGNVLDASIQRRKDRKSDGKYKCTGFGACKATFTAIHNLKSHMRSHRGERPFKCRFCPTRMVTQSDIKRHEKRCKFSLVTFAASKSL